ncbi:hypothetical protein V6N12_036151 [Hibiscus sabdariffa]|uniref:RNase H type-1 domain-containing protein n=1 Tax=Hibiscus sabdariffa TaxID=183260 RepID=A0ABR2ERM9_9ROSI
MEIIIEVKLVMEKRLSSSRETPKLDVWGGSVERRKIHWVKWTNICCPKYLGGLGVIDPNIQNRALLGKCVWKFANEKESLWQQVIRCKYNYGENSLLPVEPMYRRLSLLWNGVIKSFFKDDAVGNMLRNNFILQLVHLDEIRFLLGVNGNVSGLSREDIVADPSLADKSKTSGQSRFSVMSWTPPLPGVLKLNVDGAVASVGRAGGVGGLLRNNDGKCFLSFSRHVGQVPPLLAEILAIKIGLELFFNSA